MRELWVFGYGSLMWRPDFPHRERAQAILHGAHRALCVISHIHRGTRERPGLVLGLDHGGACHGVAFRIAPNDTDDVIAYLRAREQVTMVYREVTRPIRLIAGRQRVEALCYLVDRAHEQYAGTLSLEEQERLVRQGVGQSGANPDYVFNTVRHLSELGIRDRHLEALAARLSEEKTT